MLGKKRVTIRAFPDHVEHDSKALFRLGCEHDLERIVAKRKFDPYIVEHAIWLKIRNHTYSQWIGREEFFSILRVKSQSEFQVVVSYNRYGCDRGVSGPFFSEMATAPAP